MVVAVSNKVEVELNKNVYDAEFDEAALLPGSDHRVGPAKANDDGCLLLTCNLSCGLSIYPGGE